MSAAVCGSKRSFFEDIPSPPSSKRIRCSPSSTSPTRFSPPPEAPLGQLRSAFPHLEIEVLARALEECGNDLDSALKSLHKLCLASERDKSGSAGKLAAEGVQGGFANNGDGVAAAQNLLASDNLPSSGAEWVELLVKEMRESTSLDDAKSRASRVLEVLEKAISEGVHEEAGKRFQEENMAVKQQVEVLIKDNSLLKRAVALQHERQKDYDEMNRELQALKQLVPQFQEKLRTLEVNNYALRMHLKQAEQSSSFPARFHPDVL